MSWLKKNELDFKRNMADLRDSIKANWSTTGQELTKDVFSSPRTMIRQASVVTPGMVYGYGVIVYKSQEIKDAATAVAEGKLYEQIKKQQDAISRFQLLSPALMMQEELSALSGTHWYQFNQFSLDVDSFRKKTQQFYYPKMAHENTYRTFNVKDADAIPQFRIRDYHDFSRTGLRQVFFIYLIIVAAMLMLGYGRLLDAKK